LLMVLANIKRRTKNSFLFLLLVVLLSVFMFSCGDKKTDNNNFDTTDHSTFPLEYKGFLNNKKIYFTSIGQSYEYDSFVTNIMEKSFEIDYTADNLLESTTVSEGSVVFLFIGGSVKTLAELSLTVDSELERLNGFVNLKKQGKISLICAHLGGERRRGTTSDNMINIGFSNSDFNIYVEEGNFDYLLSTLSTKNNIKCNSITRISEMKSVMTLLLYQDLEKKDRGIK